LKTDISNIRDNCLESHNNNTHLTAALLLTENQIKWLKVCYFIVRHILIIFSGYPWMVIYYMFVFSTI